MPDIRERFPETSVIMASGVSDESVIAKCIKDGAQDYITKPFNFEHVLQSVSHTLSKRQLELQLQVIAYLKESKKNNGEQTGEMRDIFRDAI